MKNKEHRTYSNYSNYSGGRLIYNHGIRRKLSNECIPVQLNGLVECKHCLLKNDKTIDPITKKLVLNCGGIKIRKCGRNSRGFTVPLIETQLTPEELEENAYSVDVY